MNTLISQFKNDLRISGSGSLFLYENSADEADGTLCALMRTESGKHLAVRGPKALEFEGKDVGDFRFCKLNVYNSHVLASLFPYVNPVGREGKAFTIGLGDRLGLAAPGHVRLLQELPLRKVFPILAQQSIRELDLTGRSYEDVIAAAAFGVFQEGYKDGYGADGDHLKTTDEIEYAIKSGCTMITIDCSDHINADACSLPQHELDSIYAGLPEDMRERYEQTYLGRELPVVGSISGETLHQIVAVFHKAIEHAKTCYAFMAEKLGRSPDYELSVDETRTVTTPQEHYVFCNELIRSGAVPVSVAPHFSGEFEKGIDYKGQLKDFKRDLVIHQRIADLFGYKLSLHSGSDKFAVFSTLADTTAGKMHIKTSGTGWLEAMRILAEHAPALYRKAHIFALQNRYRALQYYHISTDPADITDIALQNDAYLPEYMNQPAARQTIHVAYGLLLAQQWFRDAFFGVMDAYEELYHERLKQHIGKHLKYLGIY
jgi:hypothetical protein